MAIHAPTCHAIERRQNTIKPAFCMLLLTGMLLAAGHAHAEFDALVKNARSLIDNGRAQQAFDLLEPQESQRAGDPDFDTALGIAAIDIGQFTRAVFALERALAVQPENSRARAELGRALFAVGDTKASRRVLLETKTGGVPPQASATIDQFLQAIDRTEEAARSSVKAYVEASLGYDTNLNSGPGNANVAVPAFGGLVFTLNNANLSTKASYAALGAGASSRFVVDPRLSVIGNVAVNTRVNSNNAALDTTQFDANAGLSYRYDKHEFSGVVQLGSYWVNGNTARDQAGLVGEWTYRPDGFNQWSSYLQWGVLSYPGQTIKNANRTVLGTSFAHAFRSGLLVFAGGYLGQEAQKQSALPQLGHRLYGLRTGLQADVAPATTAFASLSFENRQYGGPDPLFLVTRQDRQTNLNVGLNWVPAPNWRVTPQLALTSVRSNVAISDFNRAALSVTARRDF